MKILLKPGGVITMEFPHLLSLVEQNQWDTIYHEHFSYFSFRTVARGLRRPRPAPVRRRAAARPTAARCGSTGLTPTNADKPDTERAASCSRVERAAGFDDLATYVDYGRRVAADKMEILSFLIERKRAGQRLVGYGAPGQGRTRCSTTAGSAPSSSTTRAT